MQAREILLGGGNIHCITQQVPAPARRRRSASRASARRKRTVQPAQQGRLWAARADAARRLARRAARHAQAREVRRRRDRHRRSGRGSQRDGEQAARVARSEVRHRARVRRGRCARTPAVRRCGATGSALPARGRIAFYFWGWYADYIGRCAPRSRKAKRRAERELERIRQLETHAGADGVRVVKILSAPRRRRRNASDSNEAARRQADALARHGRGPLARAASQAGSQGDRALSRGERISRRAAGTSIDGTDEDYRDAARRRDRSATSCASACRACAEGRARSCAARCSQSAGVAARAHQPARRRRRRYDRELERLQASPGAADATLEVSQARARARVRGHGCGRQGRRDPVASRTRSTRASIKSCLFRRRRRKSACIPTCGASGATCRSAAHIAIFDRSWYGRVLVERVRGFAAPADWRRAYAEICEFERQLTEHGLIVAKFWLQVSKDEQLRRFKARDEDPLKRFKVDPEDWTNRTFYDAYQAAAAEMIAAHGRARQRAGRWCRPTTRRARACTCCRWFARRSRQHWAPEGATNPEYSQCVVC